jgi:hypothetical protein
MADPNDATKEAVSVQDNPGPQSHIRISVRKKTVGWRYE